MEDVSKRRGVGFCRHSSSGIGSVSDCTSNICCNPSDRADSVEEARKLLEIGFEFICSHNGQMLFRKKKNRARAKASCNWV